MRTDVDNIWLSMDHSFTQQMFPGHLQCCRSVAKSCPSLCNPMDGSTPGFPVLCYLPEFA